MPNRYAKPFAFYKKLIISFIINAIIKVVPTTGLEPNLVVFSMLLMAAILCG